MSCSINVTYAPTVPGTETATLTVTDNTNNVAGSVQTVSLTGTGVGAVASLTAAVVTFGSQAVGTTSPAQTITLNNSGNVVLTISGVAVTGANPADFAQTNTCGSSLPATANCTITVTFTPTGSGGAVAP